MMHIKRIRRVRSDLSKLLSELGRAKDHRAINSFQQAILNVDNAMEQLEETNIQWLSDDDWN